KENFGEKFEQWAQMTPAVFPQLSRWQRSALPFSWRSALRREYSTLLAIAASLTALEVSTDWLEISHFTVPSGFISLLLVSLIIYTCLRTLKKKTRLLDVAGR